MRRIIILVTMIIILYSCKNVAQNSVIIKANSDTIVSGNMYMAELYVSYDQSVLPAFYIFRQNDTLGLEIDTIKKCAIFRATYRTEGEKVFNGFVDYINLNGTRIKEPFSIKYYVKSE